MIMIGCNLLFIDGLIIVFLLMSWHICDNWFIYIFIYLHKYLGYDSKGFVWNLWVVSACCLPLFITLLLQLCSWATIAPLRAFYIASLTLISCLRWLAAWIKVLKVLNSHGAFKIFINAISSCLSLSGSFLF